MKRPTKSDASEPKGKVKKRAGESSATTLSRKLRDKKDGEKSKQGVQPRRDSCSRRYWSWHAPHVLTVSCVCLAGPPLKPAAVQKRTGYGSILHYIYKSTLGQSLHSQMRQVRLHSQAGRRDQKQELILLHCITTAASTCMWTLCKLSICNTVTIDDCASVHGLGLCVQYFLSCKNIFMARLICYSAVTFTGVKMSCFL